MRAAYSLFMTLGCLAAMVAEFYQDFRERPALDPALRVFGPGAEEVVTHEAEGLRIRLARNRDPSGAVGVQPRFAICGDFEITASYQILDADPGPFGPGVNLRVIVGQPMREAADLARYRRIDEGDIYFVNRATAVPGGQPRRDSMTFPARTNAGRLRLRRTGSTLQFLVAEGPNAPFGQLAQKEFVTDDCILRFVAHTGKGPGVDVRLVDLRIRADRLSPAPGPGPRRASRARPVVIIAACVVAGVMVVVGLFWWGRRKKTAATQVARRAPSGRRPTR